MIRCDGCCRILEPKGVPRQGRVRLEWHSRERVTLQVASVPYASGTALVICSGQSELRVASSWVHSPIRTPQTRRHSRLGALSTFKLAWPRFVAERGEGGIDAARSTRCRARRKSAAGGSKMVQACMPERERGPKVLHATPLFHFLHGGAASIRQAAVMVTKHGRKPCYRPRNPLLAASEADCDRPLLRCAL